ncbi:hypothetical protein PHIN8_05730 [Polynucleobacter sp. HIN8]|uniref:universal stress protein n=1 Tax=Polynucleobacter sp. HIN8 TaxID=3047867 RepID=UPI0025739134|nr:universal stress protein [Polynucleobacter sp. HIN8]BEI38629.1 hypothetical protein PHIN8_05730 [Polynucleobacter sp. HIN8]
MINSVLIPIDESVIVQQLIKKLSSYLDLEKIDIYLVNVSKPNPPATYSEYAYNDYSISIEHHKLACSAYAKKLFSKYEKVLAKAKHLELIHEFDDDIPNGIIHAAKKKKVDLIAMATHRYSGLKSILLGDKVHNVIVNSKLPVLVI